MERVTGGAHSLVCLLNGVLVSFVSLFPRPRVKYRIHLVLQVMLGGILVEAVSYSMTLSILVEAVSY